MIQHATSPLEEHDPSAPSVFLPRDLLDGARRYKNLPEKQVPKGCLLDMDGELVERLVATGRAVLDSNWPCFHTRLYRWAADGFEFGVGQFKFPEFIGTSSYGLQFEGRISQVRNLWRQFRRSQDVSSTLFCVG